MGFNMKLVIYFFILVNLLIIFLSTKMILYVLGCAGNETVKR